MMDKSILDKYELVVGLEVHVQLLTKSKAYSWDANEYGNIPNTNISIVTLAHPGTLPKPNKKVMEYAVKLGLATNSKITEKNFYDRKNYFYPDLPKGYQITQAKTPICTGGFIEIKTAEGGVKKIELARIHMEEDSGKSIHLNEETETLVDLNRAGVPLLEIVTEPDFRSSEEAYSYLTEVRKLVRYLDICDGNMEEGSMRCDANISVRLKGSLELGSKVEVKNMNSIKNVQRAIEHEFLRQIERVENNQPIPSETRTFNAVDGSTTSMRSKEDLNDYRYFPEPDLPPVIITEEYLEEVKAMMPALPNELFKRFVEDFKLPEYDARVLTDTKEVALYFDELCGKVKNQKAASNWIMGPIKSYLNELTLNINQFPLSTEKVAEVIELVENGKLSFAVASQKLFPALIEAPTESATTLAEKMDLVHDSGEDFIIPIIQSALDKFPDKVTAYKNGKKGVLGLFMGEVMKASKGKVDPKKANTLLLAALEH